MVEGGRATAGQGAGGTAAATSGRPRLDDESMDQSCPRSGNFVGV